ncbi:MAG: STY4528 family pathogenicity island replication protein [Gammaproteobacteria bacterium]
MIPDPHTIDPTTRALEAYIEASVEQILRGSASPPQHGLLFLSTWHEAMPALVHLDPVLEPVDSRVFAVLWIWAKQQGRGTTAFPTYDYLRQRCNIQSRATLARSLAILRLTRWITLCRRVRDKGRNRGNIYALHDEPLPLAATLYLDPGYMDFLKNATCHHHEHVGTVAHVLLQSLQESIDEGADILAVPAVSQTDRRLEALATIAGEGTGNYFGLRRGPLAALQLNKVQPSVNVTARLSDHVVTKPHPTQVQNLNSVPVQNLNADPVQNLNSVLRSSSYLMKTTTDRSQEDRSRASTEPIAGTRFIFPESLSRNEQALGAMYLKGLDPGMQQAVLDELGEKMLVQAKTVHRVRNAIALLAWMCNEAKAGRPPLTSAHLKHRERRDREQALQAHIEAEQKRLAELARSRMTQDHHESRSDGGLAS